MSSSSTLIENHGPLTTVFTPPASCLETIFLVSQTSTVSDITFVVSALALGHYVQGNLNCYPTGTYTQTATADFFLSYYYSPGYYCPSGWNTAALVASNWMSVTMTNSFSGAICCPLSMSYSGDAHECDTTMTSGEVAVISSSGAVLTSTIASSLVVMADGIPILWERDQLPTSSPSPVSSPTSTTTITTTIDSPTASVTGLTNTTAAGSDTRHGLAKSAKIGLGIGVALGAICICGFLAFWIFWRRRSRKRDSCTGDALPTDKSIAEPHTPYDPPLGVYELQGQNTHPAELE